MHPDIVFVCPKCKECSGDGWTRCGTGCPVLGSPHFTQAARDKYGTLISMPYEDYLEMHDDYFP